MQLLAEMDGFNPRSDVRLLAATNRLDILDPAILRPGRFDRFIEVNLPDESARESILRIHTRKMTLSEDIKFKYLAKITEGSCGSDLKAIATEAGMFAIRNERDCVEIKDMEDAIIKVLKHGKNSNAIVGNMFQ
jgi:proteasome regulatory subunit